MVTTIPLSNFFAILYAAQTFAPAENPTNNPSNFAKSLQVFIASESFIGINPSHISLLNNGSGLLYPPPCNL